MLLALAALFLAFTDDGPIDDALAATETPGALRAAFTVELSSDGARRVFSFDPRRAAGERWRLETAEGEDAELDLAGASWGAEAAPDGRLFPDDLRASFGQRVQVEDLGSAWRVAFRHRPSANDTDFDVWALERLSAKAWLEPETRRFLRLEYTLPRAVRGPDGGRLTRFDQTWFLETEPRYGLSVVTAFSVRLEAKAAFKTIRRAYRARIISADLFFASDDAEAAFAEAMAVDLQPAAPAP